LLVVGICTDDDVPPDEVLKHAGFEHTVYLPLPNAQVLAHELDKCLADIPHQLNETQMRQVGRLALGGTAADLGLHIRRAQKIARRAGHELLEFGHLAAAILETPAVPARPKISDDELAMTAHHEAGHAVMQFLEIAGGRQLQYVTIVPRRLGAGTALGFVLRQPEEDRVSISRDEAMALIRSFLGGRAAEELLRGRGQVTTGAGGGQTSDLAIATRLASFLVGRCGLGDRGSLVYRSTQPEDDPHLAGQVDALLRRQYRRTLDRLRDHWHLVTALADRLLKDQELSGDEARAVLRRAAEPQPPVGNTRTLAR
jgi:cell division protease FtsH